MDMTLGNLGVFNSAMNKAEFKEKLGRLIQYGAKLVSGVLTETDPTPSADRKELIAKVCLVLHVYCMFVDKLISISAGRFSSNVSFLQGVCNCANSPERFPRIRPR